MLADGSSDEPLGRHVAALAGRHGVRLDVVTPDFDRMNMPPGRRVRDRLQRMLELDPDFDALIVHRDAERWPRADRLNEIHAAMASLDVAWPTVPVIPVRMTEAWLLLDEQAIREVAGRPTATESLDLPAAALVEALPDPKMRLQEALAAASGHSGRRLREFERDFPAHRRQLLDRLDRSGPVCRLPAWQALEVATEKAMARLVEARI
jgi:hypothetical protein